jgi:hypothetical protein
MQLAPQQQYTSKLTVAVATSKAQQQYNQQATAVAAAAK